MSSKWLFQRWESFSVAFFMKGNLTSLQKSLFLALQEDTSGAYVPALGKHLHGECGLLTWRLRPRPPSHMTLLLPEPLLASGSHADPTFLEYSRYALISGLCPSPIPRLRYFPLLSAFLRFCKIQRKSHFVNKAFPNPQGLFPPLNPTSSTNPYHSLSCVAVSLLGMHHLLDGKGLKSRTKILFLPLSLLLTANPSPMCVDYNDVGHMWYKMWYSHF